MSRFLPLRPRGFEDGVSLDGFWDGRWLPVGHSSGLRAFAAAEGAAARARRLGGSVEFRALHDGGLLGRRRGGAWVEVARFPGRAGPLAALVAARRLNTAGSGRESVGRAT